MENKKIKYPPESAGQKMISNIPTAFPEEKILDVRKRILERAQEFETLNYIYIIDQERKLVGVISLKEVFQKPVETEIKNLMTREVIKVHPYTDQERVAILALNHNLKSIPVVDKEDRFLGIVPSDAILDILHFEHVEDFLKSAGIHNGALVKTLKGSPWYLTKVRFPWLVVGLFGGIFAARIVEFFETPLKTHFILAAFIPLIVYIADAVGTQTETLFIRNLVLDTKLEFKKYLFRDIKVGFLMGLGLALLLSLLSIFWFNSPYFIGLILGFSLFFTIISAILIGIFIPFLLQKFKKDPAIGSGPFGTIIRDILSLIIYFSVTALLLGIF